LDPNENGNSNCIISYMKYVWMYLQFSNTFCLPFFVRPMLCMQEPRSGRSETPCHWPIWNGLTWYFMQFMVHWWWKWRGNKSNTFWVWQVGSRRFVW
jgi:hypothetical protein